MKKLTPKTPDCFKTLIGIPYSQKDCWGIVVEFYKTAFEIELKNYYTEIPTTRDMARNLIYSNMGDFEEVKDAPQYGDILLIKMFGVESHIAVYIGNDTMLHTTAHSGCCIDRVLRWKHLVVGYYRIKS